MMFSHKLTFLKSSSWSPKQATHEKRIDGRKKKHEKKVQTITWTVVPVRKGTVPKRALVCHPESVAVVYTDLVHPKKEAKQVAKKGKKTKNKTKTNIRSGRRPSPEGTRLLFAGPISPINMICPVDGPTVGRHEKTRRTTRQAQKAYPSADRAERKILPADIANA